MAEDNNVYESLIKWLESIDGLTTTDVSDGVRIAQALVQISPSYFTKNWCSKIKPALSNWRLKVSNLKKIVEAVVEYYQDELSLTILDQARPDVNKIAENSNKTELAKLLQLVLGCAVNCERKQEYITKIMEMEETVQQCIMQAIQSLEQATKGRGPLSLMTLDIMDASQLQRLNTELENAITQKDFLAQQCHDLETQLNELKKDKATIQTENERLQLQLEEAHDTSAVQQLHQTKLTELKRQVDSLKEELFKSETTKDDYRMKLHDYEKQLVVLQTRNDELQLSADRALHLKDEVDALTETAEKVHAMEATIASYKKKLEEYTDLKRQIKSLEDKNNEYFQQNLSLEEELKKGTAVKSQMEFYKKQLLEVQRKYDAEIQTVDKVTFDMSKLEQQLQALNREKEVLAAERDALREANDELRYSNATNQMGNDVAGELVAPELKEKLRQLERENRLLKAKANDTNQIDCQALLEDSLQQQEHLRVQLRTSNQSKLELEAKLDEWQQKHAQLQDACVQKDHELQRMREQTRKNTEKARETIRAISGTNQGPDDVSSSRSHLNCMRESEARLITSAFFHLAENRHRQSADARLALLSAGQGATFLSRQRQPMPRKTYK